MTDGFNVPMNDQPQGSPPGNDSDDTAAFETPTAPTPPVAPNPQNLSWPPPAGSQAPPTWGSAPQGWPPPPGVTPPPPPPGPGASQWNYSYGPTAWGPAPPQANTATGLRRVMAVIAVLLLVLASAGVGAAISEAVHTDSGNTATDTLPFVPGNGSTNNGNGTNDIPNFGNGSGNGSSTDVGNGAPSNSAPAHIVSKVNPAVVNIYTTISNGGSRGEAAGTGMVITSSGQVLTNNHVIDGARSIRVQIVDTGQVKSAKVLGYNVVDDIALLQIEDVSDLKTVSFADSSKVAVGDPVVAIGNAGGRGGTPTATSGSITALDQKVTAGDVGSAKSETLHGTIQISAPIEPGDSGGPLVDSDGNVIGMNTAAAQSDDFFGQSGSSVAFAIPINKAREVARQIQNGEDSETVHVGDRGILGVQVQNVGDTGIAPVSSGALIVGVESDSPADDAGIEAGDVITSIDGKPVASASDLTAVMFPYHPDDKVEVGWVDQSGEQHTATVGLVIGPPD